LTLPGTAASRLIIALLLPDTDDFFRRARPGCTMALSPLRLQSDRAEPGAAASIHLSVTDAPAVHRIEIRNLDLPGELFESLSRHAADACGISSVLLSMLLKLSRRGRRVFNNAPGTVHAPFHRPRGDRSGHAQ